MTEYFIAKRYLRSKHKLNFITIISTFSMLGITIGVAALVIVLSVFNGFGSLVKNILVNFDPHVRITLLDESGFDKLIAVKRILEKDKRIESCAPFVEGRVVILKKSHFEIVNLKGITKALAQNSKGLSERIISGTANLEVRGTPKIILGLPLALKLSTRVGDTVEVFSANQIQKSAFSFSFPHGSKFVVGGIFDINNKEYAYKSTYALLTNVQRTLGYGNIFNGYEIRLHDISESEKVKETLSAELPPRFFKVETWYDLHKNLYNVMMAERWAAFFLLSIIIAVATFNILTSLTMSVLEKRKDIAVLRSMGLTQKGVKKIFIYQGFFVGLIGTLTGLLLGLAACYIQINFNVYPLDPMKYIINALPVEIHIADVVIIGLMSFLLTLTASLYPAKKSLKINIVQAIKWE